MAAEPRLRLYVLLPSQGMRGLTAAGSPAIGAFLVSLARYPVRRAGGARHRPTEKRSAGLRVLDSVREDGAKLVELEPGAATELRADHPGVRLVPMAYYRTAVALRPVVESGPRTAKAAVDIVLKVVSRKDRSPIAGASVVAFTDFEERVGAQGTTNSRGEVSLSLGGSTRKLERLYVYAQKGFWPGLRKSLTVSSGVEIPLQPIELGYADALRHFYGATQSDAGTGVTVGVIDTGIAAHRDLVVDGGRNTVVGESEDDWGDNGEGHGTHVAGIIAARGAPPAGIRGLAPAVLLRSYRVFGKGSSEASNYSIAKAIDRAVEDGCDLLNLSLGGGVSDEATMDAIADARSRGTLVIAAAGNDGRQAVSFPAADSLVLAVSAMGRTGTWPAGSTQAGDVAAPYGKDKKNFLAAFSNIGPEIDLTAPGVGIISTVPAGYAVMDGTSMACPAATGAAARLLASLPGTLRMKRNQERSAAMAQALLAAGRPLGFGAVYEGQGLVRFLEREMGRYILRFRGEAPKPIGDVKRIRASTKVKVIDDSSPRMLLVEAPESDVRRLIAAMPGWIMAREQSVKLPDPRPKLRRGTEGVD